MTPDPTLAKDIDTDDSELGFWELLRLLWAKKMWLLGAVVICSILLTAAAFTMTPIYQSACVLVPASAERDSSVMGSGGLGQLGGLASLAGLGLRSGDLETEEALAILRSRRFTEAFIVEHQLMPQLFPKQWDKSAGKWKADKKPPTLAKAHEYFDRRVRTVVQDKKTGLVRLQVEWKDPNDAAMWANALVEQLNREMRNRAIQKADASLGYLHNELKDTAITEVRDAINRLIEGQVKHRMLANVANEYAFRIVDKALPADRDDPVRPKKLMLIAGGPLLGLFIGLVGVLIAASVSRQQSRSRGGQMP